MVKYLKYPPTKQLDKQHEKRVKYTITALILVLILPSIYFAYKLREQKNYEQNIELFVTNEFKNKGYTLLFKKSTLNTNPKKLDLGFLTKKFTVAEIKVLNKKLIDYNILNTKLQIRQDTTDIKRYILNEINFGKTGINEKDLIIARLENKFLFDQYDNKAILSEVKIIFPEIDNLSISNHTFNKNTDSVKTIPILIYQSKKELPEASKQKISLWLQQRLSVEKIEVYKKK